MCVGEKGKALARVGGMVLLLFFALFLTHDVQGVPLPRLLPEEGQVGRALDANRGLGEEAGRAEGGGRGEGVEAWVAPCVGGL